MRHLRLLLVGTLIFTRPALANVVGTDLQNFNPITNGLDFVTVHSSETLAPRVFNLGLFLNYAVNTLPKFDSAAGNTNRANFHDTLFSADLNVGMGLAERWDIGVSMPFALAQTVDSEANYLKYAKTGSTEVRVNSKYQVWGDHDHGAALIASVNINNIKNNPYSGTGGGPTFNLEAAFDTTINRVAYAVNIGHRWRSPGDQVVGIPAEPFRNSFIASAAASYLFTQYDTKLIGEIFGSVPTQDLTYQRSRSQTSLELLVGVKHDYTTNIALHAGVGTELIQGAASPDYRIYSGVNYEFGPVGEPTPDVELMFGKPERKKNIVIPDILFDFNSSQVKYEENKRTFDLLVKYLNTPPAYTRMEIEGHTDSIGSAPYNLDLSQKRSESIRKLLIDKYGLDKNKLTAIGYGESRPRADNGNYQGRQLNRRVEFQVYRER